jgi:hypothetical protein
VHHSVDQLEALWAALHDPDLEARGRVLDPYSNPNMPGALPHIVCDDAHAQVLRIPTPDHPGRHVYARRPGGAWTELH